jgi:lipoprotein-anchoring transpeptidase ErfK/SrfK
MGLIMRIIALLILALTWGFFGTHAAEASIEARINTTTQRMQVLVDGVQTYDWRISTARKGYVTPKGQYQPQGMYKKYYSHKYHNSPMPYAIFYNGGYAVHGTNAVASLGKPASHGCVRLDTENAATLFALVTEHGRANTKIVILR